MHPLRLLLTAALLSAAPASAQGPCSWDVEPASPVDRLEAPSVLLGGKLVLLGGFANGFLQTSQQVDAFDPLTGQWTRLADMPAKVTHAGFAVDGDDLWVAGGFAGDHPGPVTDKVWVYDSVADQWSAGPPLPAPRGSAGLVRLGRGLHFFGGVLADRNTDTGDHWVLDLDQPAAGWSARAPLPLPRNHFGSIALNGLALALGGQNRHDSAPIDVAHVHAYDPASDAWTALPPLPFGRSHFEPGLFTLGVKLVIPGGRANTLGIPALSDVTLHDPWTGASQSLPPLPQALLAPGVKPLGGRLHVVGGGNLALTPLDEHSSRPLHTAPATTSRINAGGGSWTSASGADWCADFGHLGGQAFVNTAIGEVQNTQDDELYRSERSGTSAVPDRFGYRLPLPDGLHRVRLHFAEIFWGAPGGGPAGAGRRVFDVELEGVRVLHDYDIFAAVGAVAADVHTFDLEVQGGALDLELDASVDRPKISAIEVEPLAPGSFGTTCSGAPNSTGAPATLGFVGSTGVGHGALTLVAGNVPALQPSVFLLAAQGASIPFAGGELCLAPPLMRLNAPLIPDAAGAVALELLPPAGPHHPSALLQPGTTWHFQLFHRDAAAPADNLSAGLRIQFLP